MEQTPLTNQDQIIFIWRSRLARNLFRTITIVSLPGFLAASWYALDKRDFVYLPVYLGLLVAVLVIAFWNKVSDNARSWSMLGILYLIVLIDFYTEGRGSLARVFLLVFSFIATLFFGRRGAIAALIISILTMSVFAFGFVTGGLPNYQVGSAILSGWVSNIAIVACLVAMVIFSMDYVLRELIRGITESHSLAAALQLDQANLEAKVQERTAAAEAARAQANAARLQAETAQEKMETQMWLVMGQTRLAEKIHGEQNIPQLAGNIITQLCEYCGAQAGALFLLDGKKLSLVGGYAFTERPGFAGEFQLGEGLVGQAAADKRILRLNKIPPDALVISSGLASITPREVLVAPFSFSGELVGVVEIVKTSAFEQIDLELMERISESLGGAFRSAQTSQRLAELLLETRQQAGELQAKDKELRAANEELQAQAKHDQYDTDPVRLSRQIERRARRK